MLYVIAYEGFTCNIIEWIYSYRENYESECEYFENDAAVNALNKLLKFLDEGIMSGIYIFIINLLNNYNFQFVFLIINMYNKITFTSFCF